MLRFERNAFTEEDRRCRLGSTYNAEDDLITRADRGVEPTRSQNITFRLAPLVAIGARRPRYCCRLWNGSFPERPAAASAEPRGGLVLEATSWASKWQSRAAPGAKAPRCRVFGHAAWAAHFEPWPRETIGVKHILGLIAEKANISVSRRRVIDGAFRNRYRHPISGVHICMPLSLELILANGRSCSS